MNKSFAVLFVLFLILGVCLLTFGDLGNPFIPKLLALSVMICGVSLAGLVHEKIAY